MNDHDKLDAAALEWQELHREQVFNKYGHTVDRVDFRMPNGHEADYYIRYAGARVGTVLALTPDNQVILARQFRPGPMAVLNELPGGGIEQGEDPLVGVGRELTEETGYEGQLEFVGTCLDDAYSGMTRYCFVARDCRKIGEPHDTESEQTIPVLLSLDEFRQQLRSGRITDLGVAYRCLDHLGLL